MKGLNLFIAGMGKSGTTSLADWLVENGLARFRIPNLKEPYIYARAGNISLPDSMYHDEVFLDASVGYSINPYAISRMPEHNSKIILCLRNSFDRTFSAYNFFRIMCHQDSSTLELMRSRTSPNQPETIDKNNLLEHEFLYTKTTYPEKSEKTIRQYFMEQARNISSQSFMERIQYETGFFLSRRSFPFFSIMQSSFFTFPLKNLLSKYKPDNIHIITTDTLKNPDHLKQFITDILGQQRMPDIKFSPMPRMNTTTDNSAREPKPDFGNDQWNSIRSWFQQDLLSFYSLIQNNGIQSKYINNKHLDKNIL